MQESKVAAQHLWRVWQQIHDLAPAQAREAVNPSAHSGKHRYRSRNQLLYLCTQECNTDKDQSQFIGPKSNCIISNKKRVFRFVLDFFFYLYNLLFILFLSILWIFVFVILFTDLWNLRACVAVLWTSLHVWCFVHQETCWWKTLNRKQTWRAWACTMCENQILVKSCMLDA